VTQLSGQYWLLTVTSRIRSQVRPSGTCGKQNGSTVGFLRVLRFSSPILILSTAPYSFIIGGWQERPTSGQSTKWAHVSTHPTPPRIIILRNYVIEIFLKNKMQFCTRYFSIHYTSTYELCCCKLGEVTAADYIT
jgi:hypothetical protein